MQSTAVFLPSYIRTAASPDRDLSWSEKGVEGSCPALAICFICRTCHGSLYTPLFWKRCEACDAGASIPVSLPSLCPGDHLWRHDAVSSPALPAALLSLRHRARPAGLPHLSLQDCRRDGDRDRRGQGVGDDPPGLPAPALRLPLWKCARRPRLCHLQVSLRAWANERPGESPDELHWKADGGPHSSPYDGIDGGAHVQLHGTSLLGPKGPRSDERGLPGSPHGHVGPHVPRLRKTHAQKVRWPPRCRDELPPGERTWPHGEVSRQHGAHGPPPDYAWSHGVGATQLCRLRCPTLPA